MLVLRYLSAPRRDSERFPEMARWRAEVAAAEQALAGLLPAFRKQLQISSLQVGWLWLQQGGCVHPPCTETRTPLAGGSAGHAGSGYLPSPGAPSLQQTTALCTVAFHPLQFMSLHNVGDYLLEVPTELVKRVPKEWQKVRGHGPRGHGCRALARRGSPARCFQSVPSEQAWVRHPCPAPPPP